MAIKRSKSKKEDVSLPQKLDELLLNGFTCSVLEKKFKEDGKEFREGVVGYLETNDDGFEIEVSKSFATPYGKANLKTRANFDVDKDKLIELVNSGAVTIETLIHLGSFAGKKLQDAGLSDAVSEGDATEFLELRASSEFKDRVDREWASTSLPMDEAVELDLETEIKPKKKAAPKKAPAKKAAAPKDDSKAKAKAAAARIKAKQKSKVDVEDDLDSILGE